MAAVQRDPNDPQTDFKKLLSEKQYFTERGTKVGGRARNKNYIFKSKTAEAQLNSINSGDAQELFEWITSIEQTRKYQQPPAVSHEGSVESLLINNVKKAYFKKKGLGQEFDLDRVLQPVDYGNLQARPQTQQNRASEEARTVLEQDPANPNTPASNLVLPEFRPLKEREHVQKSMELAEKLKKTTSKEEADIIHQEGLEYYKDPKLDAIFTEAYRKHVAKFEPVQATAMDSNLQMAVPVEVAKSNIDPTEEQQPILKPFVVSEQSPEVKADPNYKPIPNVPDKPLLEAKPTQPEQSGQMVVIPPEQQPQVPPLPLTKGAIAKLRRKAKSLKEKEEVEALQKRFDDEAAAKVKEMAGSSEAQAVAKSNAQTKLQEAIDAAKEEQMAKSSDASIGDRYKVGLDTYTSTPKADLIVKSKAEQKKSIHTYADRTWVYSIQDSRLGDASSLKKILDEEYKMRYGDTFQQVCGHSETQAEIIKQNEKFFREYNNYRLTPLNQQVETTDRSYFSTRGNQEFGERHIGDTPDTNRVQTSGDFWDIRKNPPKQNLGLSSMFERSESRSSDRYKKDHLLYSSVVYDSFDRKELNI